MEVLGIIFGIAVIVLVRIFLIVAIQWIFVFIGTVLGGIIGLFTGSNSKPARPEAPDRQPRRPTAAQPIPDFRPKPRLTTRSQAETTARVGEVDELGVQSHWTKAEKRAHLVKQYNRYNSLMQTAKDEALRARYRERMQEITQAIMALDRLPS